MPQLGRKQFFAMAAGITAVVALPGCSSSGGASTPTGTTAITVMLPASTPELQKAAENLLAEFNKSNPSIVATLTVTPNNRDLVGAQLRSGTGPDVLSYFPGPGLLGAFQDAGLLYDLTTSYSKYNWKFFPWTMSMVSTPSGVDYSIPVQMDVIGIYYNKGIFNKFGLTVPTTLSDFTKTMDTLKSNGIVPLAFADKEGWPAGHDLSMAIASIGGAPYLNELETGKVPWNSPTVIEALDLFFNQFNKAGYLLPGAVGTAYADGNSTFMNGKSAMLPTGEWELSALESGIQFPATDLGYFPFPGKSGTGSYVGGVGQAFAISKTSKNIEGATQFLNWFATSPWVAQWQVTDFSQLPARTVSIDGLKINPIWAEMINIMTTSATNPQLVGTNIDVTQNATFNSAMTNGLQAMLTGSKTAQEVADSLQAAYTSK